MRFFLDEDDKKSQDIKNNLRRQGSQRKHMINKTQEVMVGEGFEDDLDYSQSIKNRSQKVLIKLKKTLINIKK